MSLWEKNSNRYIDNYYYIRRKEADSNVNRASWNRTVNQIRGRRFPEIFLKKLNYRVLRKKRSRWQLVSEWVKFLINNYLFISKINHPESPEHIFQLPNHPDNPKIIIRVKEYGISWKIHKYQIQVNTPLKKILLKHCTFWVSEMVCIVHEIRRHWQKKNIRLSN